MNQASIGIGSGAVGGSQELPIWTCSRLVNISVLEGTFLQKHVYSFVGPFFYFIIAAGALVGRGLSKNMGT